MGSFPTTDLYRVLLVQQQGGNECIVVQIMKEPILLQRSSIVFECLRKYVLDPLCVLDDVPQA